MIFRDEVRYPASPIHTKSAPCAVSKGPPAQADRSFHSPDSGIIPAHRARWDHSGLHRRHRRVAVLPRWPLATNNAAAQ